MPKYVLTLAYDISCYADVTIEADSPEQAERIALEKDASGKLDHVTFEPDWSSAGETRIAVEAEESAE